MYFPYFALKDINLTAVHHAKKTIREIKGEITQMLEKCYSQEEIHGLVALIFQHILHLNAHKTYIKGKDYITNKKYLRIKEITNKLIQEYPIQYLLGETAFYGLAIKVDERVLIPRPETEEMVDWVLQKNGGFTGNILDIGTGSGCIALALKKALPESNVFGTDNSEAALKVACENAVLNKLDVHFILHDILRQQTWRHERPEIIISNPPYVLDRQKEQMGKNVLEHEPHEALFVRGPDPLLYYKAIFRFAMNHLTPRGQLFVELNEYNARQVHALAGKQGFKCACMKRDLHGKYRMLYASLQS